MDFSKVLKAFSFCGRRALLQPGACLAVRPRGLAGLGVGATFVSRDVHFSGKNNIYAMSRRYENTALKRWIQGMLGFAHLGGWD